MGVRRGVDKSRCIPPSPSGKKNCHYMGAFLLLFSHGRPFATFFSLWGPFFHVGAFLLFFHVFPYVGDFSWFLWETFFGLPPPPPLLKFLRAPMAAAHMIVLNNLRGAGGVWVWMWYIKSIAGVFANI